MDKLGCDILVGEPAKIYNKIVTHPAEQLISTVCNDNKPIIVKYSVI